MDADCIIKLTKAGLKEDVCKAFSISIPQLVKEEVVDRGKSKNLPDAFLIEQNVQSGALTVLSEMRAKKIRGEDEVILAFRNGGYDAIGSDDRQFIRHLKAFHIPYVTPAVCIAVMVRQGMMTRESGFANLDALAPYISDDEYYTVRLFLERGRKS
ncbi:MAG: hypothetical protein A2X56_15105 [Nitrospirae bacterium GWC2_57_13]|nr:MAG: hypothetical protein A2072_03180 [Nitrospirae bacterium GWC1_57_7]OGW28037.1 MAG: hypothetical protein A2X56_15105 [Nitrospirae bacterium GWC2_57_13]HAS53745.1 hypothetical protein [Nitrospiraceae bacterium]